MGQNYIVEGENHTNVLHWFMSHMLLCNLEVHIYISIYNSKKGTKLGLIYPYTAHVPSACFTPLMLIALYNSLL